MAARKPAKKTPVRPHPPGGTPPTYSVQPGGGAAGTTFNPRQASTKAYQGAIASTLRAVGRQREIAESYRGSTAPYSAVPRRPPVGQVRENPSTGARLRSSAAVVGGLQGAAPRRSGANTKKSAANTRKKQ